MDENTDDRVVAVPQQSFFTVRDYLERLRRGKMVILVSAVLVPLLAFLFSVMQPEIYRSETQILIKPLPVQEASTIVSAPLVNLETERRLVYSEPVLREAISRSGSQESSDQFADTVDVTPLPQTELLVIGVSDEEPAQAQAAAAALAESYLEFRATQARGDLNVVAEGVEEQLDLAVEQRAATDGEIETTLDRMRSSSGSARRLHLLDYKQLLKQRRSDLKLESDLRQQLAKFDPSRSIEAGVGVVVEPADLPADPISPQPLRSLAFGFLAGLILGACAALVFYSPILRKELAVA